MSSDRPGTDWEAKHEAAGQNARPVEDRPYKPDWGTVQPVQESDVVMRPASGDDGR